MFSEHALKIVDACRFCWMCRHLCPVGLKTGKESNTPRGKALLAHFVRHGTPYTAEMAADFYECCLCNACAEDCETGYEPAVFIREARTQAYVEGVAPDAVQRVIDNTIATGNIFGLGPDALPPALAKAIVSLPENAETLVYLGGVATYKTPEIALALLSLLKKAGVSFTAFVEEPSSGADLGDLIGFVDIVREAATVCAQRINASGAKTIVVLDPAGARMFRQQYAAWGIELGGEVVTASSYVAAMIAGGRLTPRPATMAVTLQDDSTLTRDLDETEAPREIISALGVDLREMYRNRKQVKNGGTALMTEYRPDLTRLTGEGRWEDALRTKAAVLLTVSPESFYVMQRTVPEGMEIRDLLTLLDAYT